MNPHHRIARAPLSRRRLLKNAAFAAGALAAPAVSFRARAAGLKPVTFTLDWLYQGASVGFLVAHEKGFIATPGST